MKYIQYLDIYSIQFSEDDMKIMFEEALFVHTDFGDLRAIKIAAEELSE